MTLPFDPDAALTHLSRDARLAAVIERVGPLLLSPEADHFLVLARAIVGQQISVAAARSIMARVTEACGGRVTAAKLTEATDEQLRACGLSAGKLRYLRSLASHALAEPEKWGRLAELPDAEVSALLRPVAGIGPWTVEMFLMFALCRPDVLPVGDLGIRQGVRDLFGLEAEPKPLELEKLTQAWRPYRTVACWYLWRRNG